jgi:hypothetical protein
MSPNWVRTNFNVRFLINYHMSRLIYKTTKSRVSPPSALGGVGRNSEAIEWLKATKIAITPICKI